MEKLSFESYIGTFTFSQELSKKEQVFISDIFNIGQRIKDQKTLIDILCVVFKLTKVATGRFIDISSLPNNTTDVILLPPPVDSNVSNAKLIKLWNKLKKELKPLNDNNYTARIIYDYVNKNFKPK
jgi:hypothetical protein